MSQFAPIHGDLANAHVLPVIAAMELEWKGVSTSMNVNYKMEGAIRIQIVPTFNDQGSANVSMVTWEMASDQWDASI